MNLINDFKNPFHVSERFPESGLSSEPWGPCVPLRSGHQPQIRASLKLRWADSFLSLGLLELSLQSPGHSSACCTRDETLRAPDFTAAHPGSNRSFRMLCVCHSWKTAATISTRKRDFFLTHSLNVENDKRERPLQTDPKSKSKLNKSEPWT